MYTHLVRVQTYTELNVIVWNEYRTTADAVELHREACQKRFDVGQILAFEIVEL